MQIGALALLLPSLSHPQKATSKQGKHTKVKNNTHLATLLRQAQPNHARHHHCRRLTSHLGGLHPPPAPPPRAPRLPRLLPARLLLLLLLRWCLLLLLLWCLLVCGGGPGVAAATRRIPRGPGTPRPSCAAVAAARRPLPL